MSFLSRWHLANGERMRCHPCGDGGKGGILQQATVGAKARVWKYLRRFEISEIICVIGGNGPEEKKGS